MANQNWLSIMYNLCKTALVMIRLASEFIIWFGSQRERMKRKKEKKKSNKNAKLTKPQKTSNRGGCQWWGNERWNLKPPWSHEREIGKYQNETKCESFLLKKQKKLRDEHLGSEQWWTMRLWWWMVRLRQWGQCKRWLALRFPTWVDEAMALGFHHEKLRDES